MQKIILRNNSTINPFKLIKTYLKTRTVFNKLKDLVANRSRFEEESMLYTYEGEDKNAIWEVMEFFYVSLWTKEFDPFVYTDPADDWENYNFYIHYKGKYTLISIIYGVGSTCIIAPVELDEIKTTKKIIELENLEFNIFGKITYKEDYVF